MTLLWAESGGPAVAQPTRAGFGTRLIARTFGQESGGRASIDYLSEGARCVIELPLSDPAEIPVLDLNGTAPQPPKSPAAPSPHRAT